MGKKQHSKDRLYLTTKEWKEEWGGYKDRSHLPFKRLPFNCCAISFRPFEDPVCTEEGTVYDIVSAVPYIQKHKKHPVTGEPLALKDLIKLNYHKNADGEYCCPVTNKVFTEHTHIVAVKNTGNVYSWDAVDELNIKPRNWKDLLTEEPFTRKDIIHLQDPLNLQGKDLNAFDHVKKGLSLEDPDADEPPTSIRNPGLSEDLNRALTAAGKADNTQQKSAKRAEASQLLSDAKSKAASTPPITSSSQPDWRLQAPEPSRNLPKFKPGTSTWDTDDYSEPAPKKAKTNPADAKSEPTKLTPEQWYAPRVKYEESFFSTGEASRAFTSSVMPIATKNKRQMIRRDINPTKKAHVRLHTSHGDLNVELHCDLAPRTCENFLALCDMGYYDNTIFHRSIKNFMIQGGDPTGTGTGGESIYGKNFKDELDSRLLHVGRGVLSMANSGPNTNGSQFYILYKSARHLDYKHTVFGRVVGGMETLSAMEKVPTDRSDRPKEEIKITGATVFTNPYKEMMEEEAAADAAKAKAENADDDPDNKVGRWLSNPGNTQDMQPVREGVGKYLTALGSKPAAPAAGSTQAAAAKKPKAAASGFGNFDSW